MKPGPPSLFWRTIWIVFLVLPAWHLIDERASAGRVAAVLVALAAFIAIYVRLGLRRTWGVRTRSLLALVAVQAVIAVLLTTLEDPDWGLAFIYLAATVGVRWASAGLVGAIAALCVACVVAGGGDAGLALGYATPAAGVGILMVMIGRLGVANAELREAREALAERAVSEERARFARDLHDLLGHSLSVIALKAELAGRLVEHRPQDAGQHVREIETVAREALAEVRETVSGYRRPTLEGELAGARLALDAAGVHARIEDRTGALAPEAEAVVAWAVREGTTNVIRHSGARHCAIVVSDDGVEIIDDGRGVAPRTGAAGHGIDGLRERAEQVHATVEAGAAADGGFSLRVALP